MTFGDLEIKRNNVDLEVAARRVRKYIEDNYDCELIINYENGRRLIKIVPKKEKDRKLFSKAVKKHIIEEANKMLGGVAIWRKKRDV